MCYYCIELTANQKERLEPIIIVAALIGIILNKLLEKKMTSFKMTKEFIEVMDNLIDNTIELAKKTNVHYGCITAYLLPQITEEQ